MFRQRPGVPDNAVLSNIIDSDYTASPPRCISDVHVQYSGDFDFGQGEIGVFEWGRAWLRSKPPVLSIDVNSRKKELLTAMKGRAFASIPPPIISVCGIPFFPFRFFFTLLLALCLPQQH